MEPVYVALVVILLAALAAGGHLLARYAWPTRRRLWRRRALNVEQEARELGTADDLEKPEAGMGPDAGPPRSKAQLRRRRKAGSSHEDIDY